MEVWWELSHVEDWLEMFFGDGGECKTRIYEGDADV
jgi:hypothetical protein